MYYENLMIYYCFWESINHSLPKAHDFSYDSRIETSSELFLNYGSTESMFLAYFSISFKNSLKL
jgi:hypothetical protein